MKRHNVRKRHVVTDTGFKQSERTIFSPRYFNGTKIVTAFKCIFEEIIPKLSVNFGNHISQDSHKKKYRGPVCNFGFTEPQ